MLSGISSGIPSVICYNGNMQKKVIHTENTPYGLLEIYAEILLCFCMQAGNQKHAPDWWRCIFLAEILSGASSKKQNHGNRTVTDCD